MSAPNPNNQNRPQEDMRLTECSFNGCLEPGQAVCGRHNRVDSIALVRSGHVYAVLTLKGVDGLMSTSTWPIEATARSGSHPHRSGDA